MKKFILLAITIFISNILFADISGDIFDFAGYRHLFGLEMGMTLKDVKELCDGKEPVYKPRLFMVFHPAYKIEPTTKNKTFPYWYASIHNTLGLFAVTAFSDDFTHEHECKEVLDNIVSILKDYYGEPLRKSDGHIVWKVSECEALEDYNLKSISLRISGHTNLDSTWYDICLTYKFDFP